MKNEQNKSGRGKRILKYIFLWPILMVFYKLPRDPERGWYLKKRMWTLILFSPVIFPVFLLSGILQSFFDYYSWMASYTMSYLNGELKEGVKMDWKLRTRLKEHLL